MMKRMEKWWWIVIVEEEDDVVYCYGIFGDSQMLYRDHHHDNPTVLAFVGLVLRTRSWGDFSNLDYKFWSRGHALHTRQSHN